MLRNTLLTPVSTTTALRVASDSERYVALHSAALAMYNVARHIATYRCEKDGDILRKVTKVPHNFHHFLGEMKCTGAGAEYYYPDPFNGQ